MSNLEQIRTQLSADTHEPGFMLCRRRKLRALCLRTDLNPKTFFHFVEVWVGTDPLATEWGQRLAEEKGIFPVFTAENDQSEYRCIGHYCVRPRQPTTDEFAAAQAQAHYPLSRVIFLDRAHVSEMLFR